MFPCIYNENTVFSTEQPVISQQVIIVNALNKIKAT